MNQFANPFLVLLFLLAALASQSQTCQNLNFSEVSSIPSSCFQITMTALHDQLDRPYLYVAGKEAGLKIYDLTDSQAPVSVAAVPSTSFENLHVMNLHQKGNYLYLAIGNHFGTAQQSSGLAIVDVSQPDAPALTDFWKVQAGDGGAGIVAVEGDLAYLGAMKHGLIVLDVADKHDIQFVSQFVPELDFPDPNPDASKINARGMEVRNGLVYLAYDAGGLRIIDATDPAHPAEIGRYSNPALDGLPRAYNNLVLDGDLVYVTVDYCGLEVLDVSDPENITLKGWWNPWNCQSNPFNWFVSPGHTNELALLPGCDLLFVASGKSDLHVLDISDPAQPDSCNFFGGVGNGIGTWGVSVWKEQAFLSYICSPFGIPFPSNWTGVKVLNFEADCLTSGSKEMGAETPLSVQPNPVFDRLTVRLPGTSACELALRNALGQPVLFEKIAAGETERALDCSRLSSGVYFLTLQGKERGWTRRVVKW